MLENTQTLKTQPAREPQSTRDWVEKWASQLLADGAEAKLSKDLVKRWKQNSPTRVPAGLRSPISDAVDWSISLEKFLLSEHKSPEGADNAEKCAKVLVLSFKGAMKEWPGNLGSIVWFRDVAALRRVAYGNERTRQDVAELIVSTLGKLAGASVEPKRDHYMHLEKLYAVASNCMVSELYEKEVVRHQYMAGLTGGNFSEFTVMWILEKARLQKTTPDRDVYKTHSPFEPDSEWLSLGEVFQSTIDGLFDTLLSISAQAEDGQKSKDKANAFRTMLKKVSGTGSHGSNQLPSYWGFQRLLDLHWVRISAMVSVKKWSLSVLVRNFIRQISHVQENMLEKIQHCRLSEPSGARQLKYGELLGTLQPKHDPAKGFLKVIVGGDGKAALTVDLPEEVEAMLNKLDSPLQVLGAQR